MPTCANNYYFSGQGSLMVAERHTDGTPKGFTRVGNVPSLEISIEVTKFEHKESCTGQRAIDLTVVQEKNGTFTMTLENFTPFNLALGFWGQEAQVAAATGGTARTFAWEYDKPHYLDAVSLNTINSVTVDPDTGGGGPQVLVLDDDYTIDLEYGTITFLSTGTIIGSGGTDPFPFTASADDTVEVDYDSDAYHNVDALTVTSQQRWIRFEGLNTIDEKPVIVDMFKADIDPITGLALINEEIAAAEITGNLLIDTLQPGASQYFRVRYAETAF